MISQKLLQELREIIKSEKGIDLSMEEVSEIGNGMVDYYNLLARMYHENNQEDENEIPSTKI